MFLHKHFNVNPQGKSFVLFWVISMSPWNLLVPLEEQLKVWSLVELHFIFQVSVSPRLSKENAKKEFLLLVFIFQATSASQAFLIGMSLDSDFGNAHAPCLFWFFQKPARVEVTLMRGFNWMRRVSKCFQKKMLATQ